MPTRSRFVTLFCSLLILCLAGVAAPAVPANAQDQNQAQQDKSNEQLLADFNHWVLIRKDDLAQAAAKALLDRGLEPVEFVGLVEDSRGGEDRFTTAIRQAMLVEGIEPLAAQLQNLFEQGRLDRARDPQRIAENIDLLDGNQRARMLARERLAFAGEYAVPQLFEVLQERRNQTLEAEVQRLLVEMGADAVAPLTAALLKVEPVVQRRLATVLGRSGQRAALPYLFELAKTAEIEPVRHQSRRAVERIMGDFNPDLSPAELYLILAESYYDHSRSLTRFPDESHQLLWTYEPQTGLYSTPIRTEVYHEARAMEICQRALSMDPSHREALSLWLAANFSREIDQPQGYDNPAYGGDRRDATYYAVAAGPGATQSVLARALADRDTPLARRVIRALRRSAGGAGVWRDFASSKPLIDALSYPDRRVQYEAALALGAANPADDFPGTERVVPTLANAVRNAQDRFAVVLSRDLDRQQDLAEILQNEDYTVLPPGETLSDIRPAIAEAPGVDLILTDLLTDQTRQTIQRARRDPKLRAAPVLALLPGTGYLELRSRYQGDALTEVRRLGVSDQQLIESARSLVREAAGPPVTEQQAEQYATEALRILAELAMGESPAFNLADAARPLIAALDETTGEVRLRVADVLARIGEQRTQRAVVAAALHAQGEQRVRLLQAAARSARRFGNMLQRRQVDRLIKLAEDAPTTDEATAAAALMGALNLQGDQVLPLILQKQ